jgi:CspA family cold shock protein
MHVRNQRCGYLQKTFLQANIQKTPGQSFASDLPSGALLFETLSLPSAPWSQKQRKEVAPVAQYKGTVKWFNNAKGYGFLGRDGGAVVFVHYSSIQREGYKSLKEGDEVEFDIIQGSKGPQADQVARLKEAQAQ